MADLFASFPLDPSGNVPANAPRRRASRAGQAPPDDFGIVISSGYPGSRAEAGGLLCVADARIDNAVQLAARLGLPSDNEPTALILHLYRSVGLDCTDLLEGDFAFVLWDAPRRRIVAARDRFGVKPLYMAEDGDGIVLASDLGRIPLRFRRDFSDVAAASYLAGIVPDDTATFFARVKRLPPAAIFVRDRGGTCVRKYWKLQYRSCSPEPAASHAEHLRELLDRSVCRRLAGAKVPGTLLSGGLDSSSIAGLLRDRCEMHVPTFSLVFSEPGLAEKEHIESVLGLGGFEAHFLDGAKAAAGPFTHLTQMLQEMHEPFLAPNLAAMRPLFAAARERGVDLLFDGHGGDEVVSHGFELLPRLARDGEWLALWRALAAADTFGQQRPRLFLQHLRRHKRGRSRWLTGPLSRLLGADRDLPQFSPLDLVDADFAHETDLRDRIASTRSTRHGAALTEQDHHLARLTGPTQAYGFEILDRINRAAGIEGRYPFWDREVVEFCLSLPVETKLAEGWSRLVLRRAMEPVLPSSVVWRRDKIDFSGAILRGMIGDPARTVDRALGGCELEGYLDLSRARNCWSELTARPKQADARKIQAIWRFAVFAAWLEQRGQSGVEPQDRPKELVA